MILSFLPTRFRFLFCPSLYSQPALLSLYRTGSIQFSKFPAKPSALDKWWMILGLSLGLMLVPWWMQLLTCLETQFLLFCMDMINDVINYNTKLLQWTIWCRSSRRKIEYNLCVVFTNNLCMIILFDFLRKKENINLVSNHALVRGELYFLAISAYCI